MTLGWTPLDELTRPKIRNVGETNRDGYEGKVPYTLEGIERAAQDARRELAMERERRFSTNPN